MYIFTLGDIKYLILTKRKNRCSRLNDIFIQYFKKTLQKKKHTIKM